MPQPPAPKQTRRERERQARKRSLATQQVAQFEDELSGHELNIARANAQIAALDAVPESSRDDAWARRRDDTITLRGQSEQAVAALRQTIDATIAEAKALGASDAELGLTAE